MQQLMDQKKSGFYRHRRAVYVYIVVAVLLVVFMTAGMLYAWYRPAPPPTYSGPRTFWQYQCIDTMKSSRDQARAWLSRSATDNAKDIDSQMKLIAASGANCVAIDTPYDAEFLPILQAWVAGAREQRLHVWFRGNFSGWEGWFGYPASLTPAQLLTQGEQFIRSQVPLFQDQDIFTLAPEAENGQAFTSAGTAGYGAYRKFLVDEHRMQDQVFTALHKQVVTNWLSMSGGVARASMDHTTVGALGGVVAIDHYVAAPNDMGTTIDWFNKTLQARVVVGEWGAPIPGINGSMTVDQQAQFVAKLLDQMVLRAQNIGGVNYWTLTGGSTQLVDEAMTPLPAYATLQRYYRPTVLMGTVKGSRGKRMRSVTITIGGIYHATTDKYGNYALLVPSGVSTIQAARGPTKQVLLPPDQSVVQDISINF